MSEVIKIGIAKSKSEEIQEVTEINLSAGKGIIGDRYFHEKNEVNQIHQGSSQEASQSSRTSKKHEKSSQRWFWKRPERHWKIFKKSSENIVLNDFLDLFFQIFPCWRMWYPCGGTRGPLFNQIIDS